MVNPLKKYITIYTVIPLFCFVFYVINIKTGFRPFDLNLHLNYFRLYADALLNGRLDLVNLNNVHDLVFYKQKYYIYWPPVPALIYMPIVAIFGTNLPDALINSLFGMVNVWLVMKICSAFNKKYSLSLTGYHIACFGLFWGLGTVHFYMSKDGSVWLVSQIMAQTFLLASILILISLKHSTSTFLFSGIFFALAVYTRNHLIFSIFLIVGLSLPGNDFRNIKPIIKRGMIFILPFLVFSFLNCWYNYARFGDIFENGIRYHLMDPYFVEKYKQYGFMSWHYLPHNFYTEVLRMPSIDSTFPFIVKEPEGFGFIWGSPFFLLLMPVLFLKAGNFEKKVKDIPEIRFIKTGNIISLFSIALIIFLIMGTGWVQFCARYTLDFYIFLIIALLFSWKYLLTIPYFRIISIVLLLLSFAVQFIGAWQYSYM